MAFSVLVVGVLAACLWHSIEKKKVAVSEKEQRAFEKEIDERVRAYKCSKCQD